MSSRMSTRRIIVGSILFLTLFLVYLLPYRVNAANANEWEYTVSSGEATLTKYLGNSAEISIPSSVNGYPVTEIGSKLFYQSNIRSLTIPECIEYIGAQAFADCKYLTTINYNAKNARAYFSRSMMSLHVFVNAGKFSNSLTVTFGPSVDTIPTCLFEASDESYAHVTKIIMSNNVHYINDWAFSNCFDLKNVDFGTGLLEIGHSSFENCLGLTTITIPNRVERIGEAAFANCKYLNTFYFNAVNCKIDYFRSENSSFTFRNAGKFSNHLDVIIGNGVKVVPTCFFEASNNEYAHVTSVIIPSSVVEMGDFAFNNCYDLKIVTIYSRNCKIPMDNYQYGDAFTNCPKGMMFKLYRGSAAVSFATKKGFKISYLDSAIDISKCTVKLSNSTYTYNGSLRKPSVYISYKNTKLKSSVDYSIDYKNNKIVGTAIVTIKGRGKYTGTIRKTFTIIPYGTKINKIDSISKGFKVAIKTQKTQTTGYQIQYAINKNFKNAKIKSISNSKNTIMVNRLSAKRNYYVRVRTYKVIGNKKYYSTWSAVKIVKTKK